MQLPERSQLSLGDAAQLVASRCSISIDEARTRLAHAFYDYDLHPVGHDRTGRIAEINWRAVQINDGIDWEMSAVEWRIPQVGKKRVEDIELRRDLVETWLRPHLESVRNDSETVPRPAKQPSHTLTNDDRMEGAGRTKINNALQTALNRIAADLDKQNKRLTRGNLRTWVSEHTPCNELGQAVPYEFDPMIPNCDALYIDGAALVWKDREGCEQSRKVKNLDRYIERAQGHVKNVPRE